MKKLFMLSLAMIFTIGTAAAVSAESPRGVRSFETGGEAYFCQCDGCTCDTLSNNPGQCTCGVELVKGKVKSVAEDGRATVDINGKEKTFKNKGKFTCACPPSCTCNTISQNPGNCTCGKAMKEIAPE